MKLRITTPLSIVVEEETVASLRAEDMSGSFGILPGHADFLTTLEISVVSWTNKDGAKRYCAVRGGVLAVNGGTEIAVETREAVPADQLEELEPAVIARFHTDLDLERRAHVEGTRLQLAAIRQIMRHLRPDGRSGKRSFR